MLKSFNEFIYESVGNDLPEDKINKILDKHKKKKLDPQEKKNLIKLAKKHKTNIPPKNIADTKQINITDLVVYSRKDSVHYGKNGFVLRIRKDGKFIVRFDDGSKLACSVMHLIKLEPTKAMKKLDPYNEEDW